MDDVDEIKSDTYRQLRAVVLQDRQSASGSELRFVMIGFPNTDVYVSI